MVGSLQYHKSERFLLTPDEATAVLLSTLCNTADWLAAELPILQFSACWRNGDVMIEQSLFLLFLCYF